MSEADYNVPTVRVGKLVVLDHSRAGQRCQAQGYRVDPVYTLGGDLIGLSCACGRQSGCRTCAECGQVFLVGKAGKAPRTYCTDACQASSARERARQRGQEEGSGSAR